jgi:sec-independent protein translocase protein TatC
MKYLLEIKNRFFLLFLTYSSTIIVSYCYKDILLFTIVQPRNILNEKKFTFFYFIFTDVTEIFYVYVKLIIFSSFQIIALFILYHFYLFISPALFKNEYQYLKSLIKMIVFFWFLSLIVANYLVIPFSWNFFLSFQELIIDKSFNIHFEARLSEYFNFYLSLYYVCGFYFQFFVLFFFILNYFNTNFQNIKKFRKIYYFCFICGSSLICPDLISLILLSFVFIIIYELFLLVFLFNIFKKIFK